MKEQDFGIFLSFQNPEEIAGIKTTDFLRFAKTKISSMNFALRVAKEIENLNMKKDMQSRYLNVGFSGGEKKKNEILQLSILKPKLAMLDEVDSGLDVDATRDVEDAIIRYFDKDKAIIMISHHSEMVHRVKPDFVHVLSNGKIERTGDITLIEEIQKYRIWKTKIRI